MAIVARAVEMIGALRLEDGDYAYRADETGEWYRLTELDLEDLEERIAAGERDAYSLWCASPYLEEIEDTDHDTLDAICNAGGAAEHDYRCQCGTATGERCRSVGPRRRLLHVRWVPESLRGSAKASGTYTRGGAARDLYLHPECAEMLAHEWVDGEQTEDLDPFVFVVGPAYEVESQVTS